MAKGKGHAGHPFAGLPVRERAFIIAEGQQEGTYSSVNSSSGALGRWQVLPSNVAAWTKAALGRALTPDQFLHSHSAQDAVAVHQLGGDFERYGLRGAASAWYSGSPSNKDSTASQSGGPSIYDYTMSVKAKTNAVEAKLKGNVAGPIVAPSPRYKAPKAARDAADRLYKAGLRGNDLLYSLAFLWHKTQGRFDTNATDKTIVSKYIVSYKADAKTTIDTAQGADTTHAFIGKSLYALKQAGHPTSFTLKDYRKGLTPITGHGGVGGDGLLNAGGLVVHGGKSVLDVGGDVVNAAEVIPHAVAWFFQADHIVRILFVLVGLAMVIIGLQKLTGETAVPVPAPVPV